MKQVTAAIITEGDNVLIARRASQHKLGGFWEFPGGKLDEGETLKECIEREILEELGVNSKANEEFTRSIYKYEHGTIELIAIFVEILSYGFQLEVHDRICMIPTKELLSYKLAPADIKIAKELIEWMRSKHKV